MFAFQKAKETKLKKNKAYQYPFVEVYLDPRNDYKIAWYYPDALPEDIMALTELYFGEDSNEDVVDFSEKGRAQFLQQLEEAMSEFSDPENQDKNTVDLKIAAEKELLPTEDESTKQKERIEKLEELEAVMNRGMDFLSGMFKMSTGKEFSALENKIEVNKETGEVVMRFKMPV